MLKKIVLVCGCFCVTSCKENIDTKEALIEYINNAENGLKKTENVGDVKAVMTYQPWQLQQIRLKGKDRNNSQYKTKYFFVLSLSAHNKELFRQLGYSKYSEMVQKFSFRMSDYITVSPDKSRASMPDNCIYIPTYGISKSNELLIVFNKAELKRAAYLNIRVNEFGLNTGSLNFNFKTKDIIAVSNVILN